MNLRRSREEYGRFLAALSHGDYRTFWTASVTSGAAAWALIVARGWLVFDLSDSSLWVGVVTFGAMIPRVLVPPLSGYLSDRFDRRAVLSITFGLNAVQNLALAVLVLTGTVEIWHLIVLSLLNGSARAAQMSAAQALLPSLVPRSMLLNAVALNQAALHGSRLLGPAAIAPLLALGNAEGAFFLCSGFYAFSLLQTLRIRTASTGTIDRARGLVSNMTAGLVYVYQTPMLRAIVLLALLHCGFTMSFESLLPVLSKEQFGAEGGVSFSYLMMAVGAGALMSVVLVGGMRSEAARGRLFLNLGVLSGVAPIILAMSTNMPMALVSAAGMGAAQGGFMTLTHTMIQSITPDGVRGRVVGIYSVHVGGIMASANLVNGGLADVTDAPLLLVVAGVAFIAVMFVSWRRFTFREIYAGRLHAGAHSAAD